MTNTRTNTLMGILLNGVAQLEYDRTRPLPDHQAVYLEKMDRKMDDGIEVDGEVIENPDMDYRARFIAANLAHAILGNNEAMAAAMCTWLGDRLPDLQQVKITEADGEVSIDLVFDEPYRKQVAVPVPELH